MEKNYFDIRVKYSSFVTDLKQKSEINNELILIKVIEVKFFKSCDTLQVLIHNVSGHLVEGHLADRMDTLRTGWTPCRPDGHLSDRMDTLATGWTP